MSAKLLKELVPHDVAKLNGRQKKIYLTDKRTRYSGCDNDSSPEETTGDELLKMRLDQGETNNC